MISGPVRVAVIVASCPPSQHAGALDRSEDGEVRLTVVVGIMIGVVIGLIAAGGRGVVSAVVVVALVEMLASVSWQAGRGNILGYWCQSWSHRNPFRWIRTIGAS